MTAFMDNASNNNLPGTQLAQRCEDIIDLYIEDLDDRDGDDPTQRIVTLVARSPLSSVAAAVEAKAPALNRRGVVIRVVFGEIDCDTALISFLRAIGDQNTDADETERLRWVRNPCLRDAHEQLILGTRFAWAGDTLRRSDPNKWSNDLFEQDEPETVRLGQMAFHSLWSASAVIPPQRLCGRPPATFVGSRDSLGSVPQHPPGPSFAQRALPSFLTRH